MTVFLVVPSHQSQLWTSQSTSTSCKRDTGQWNSTTSQRCSHNNQDCWLSQPKEAHSIITMPERVGSGNKTYFRWSHMSLYFSCMNKVLSRWRYLVTREPQTFECVYITYQVNCAAALTHSLSDTWQAVFLSWNTKQDMSLPSFYNKWADLPSFYPLQEIKPWNDAIGRCGSKGLL